MERMIFFHNHLIWSTCVAFIFLIVFYGLLYSCYFTQNLIKEKTQSFIDTGLNFVFSVINDILAAWSFKNLKGIEIFFLLLCLIFIGLNFGGLYVWFSCFFDRIFLDFFNQPIFFLKAIAYSNDKHVYLEKIFLALQTANISLTVLTLFVWFVFRNSLFVISTEDLKKSLPNISLSTMILVPIYLLCLSTLFFDLIIFGIRYNNLFFDKLFNILLTESSILVCVSLKIKIIYFYILEVVQIVCSLFSKNNLLIKTIGLFILQLFTLDGSRTLMESWYLIQKEPHFSSNKSIM